MNLAKTQLLSLITKAITTALGIIQSILIVRFLSPAEFGLVGLVMSIGSVIGVSQHLGIVDGAIREIAILKNKREIGKVLWVSHLTRQIVTIPLSLLLLVLAEPIASGIYSRPEIIPYIRIFAVVLILQGLQDVMGATLTGMKKFMSLYVVQIVTAAINIAVFGYLTWRYGISGFFWAVAITTTIMIILFQFILRKQLRGSLSLPTKEDIRQYGRAVMRIGAFMYLSRIFYVLWQRLPILLLGSVLVADELGYVNVSLTFGSRLTILAMALSEVNLSWMSSLYAHKRHEFVQQVTQTMQRVLVLMLLMTLTLIFFAPEIIQYIIGPEYLPAQPLIIVMTIAFFLYSLVDIGTSSVFVPADNPKLRAAIFGTMTAISAIITAVILVTSPHAFTAALALLAGSVFAYILMIVIARRSFGVNLLSRQLAVLLLALGVSGLWLYQDPSLPLRIGIFLILASYTGWEAYQSKLIPDFRKLRLRGLSSSQNMRAEDTSISIICFAGAAYNLPSWTNRQHVSSRLARTYPVLYIEPRVWIVRYIARHLMEPKKIFSFFKKLFWYEKAGDNLYIKAQWNLIPWSREYRFIGAFNHALNRWNIILAARALGFYPNGQSVMWIYDTEAAEYLSAFSKSIVVYDCVDDHAAQAGVDRNPEQVHAEENAILQRADLVTVTSKHLLSMRNTHTKNIHLVLNAGDVELYQKPVSTEAEERAAAALNSLSHPILGTVGALDSYKVDFDMLYEAASTHPEWQFVFLGSPVVDQTTNALKNLQKLSNVRLLGSIPREHVPAYVKYFDICLIPYRDSAYNAASFPLKFWEFMATGKPVVVRGVPELEEYAEYIGYAHSNTEFINLIETWLDKKTDHMRDRIDLARVHSWDTRVEKLNTLLLETISTYAKR